MKSSVDYRQYLSVVLNSLIKNIDNDVQLITYTLLTLHILIFFYKATINISLSLQLQEMVSFLFSKVSNIIQL